MVGDCYGFFGGFGRDFMYESQMERAESSKDPTRSGNRPRRSRLTGSVGPGHFRDRKPNYKRQL